MIMSTYFKSEETISNTWDSVWNESRILDWDKDFISQLVYKTVRSEIGNTRGLKILEAGCGTGRISLKLGNNKATITLIDSSPKALEIAQRFAKEQDGQAYFTRNSIFNISFKNRSFDIVWNVGVLEHFLPDEQRIILNEMLRICKNEGKVIILVPYSKAVLYRIGKWSREKLKLWKVGHEIPLKTLKHLIPGNNCVLVKEYFLGISEQTFLLPKGFKKITKLFLDFLIKLGLRNFLGKLLGGYLLVSIIEKNLPE